MEQNIYPPGTLVHVTSYGPFRGLRGTVKVVDSISDGSDMPFCFYLITLEGTQMKEPMWFECNEVGLVALPNIGLEA